MKKKNHLPNKIPVFPLSNFIIFPRTTVPLNIFEQRYIEMIDDSMNNSKMIGLIQPKKKNYSTSKPELYDVGCVGEITNFAESNDGRYLIVLSGLSRFKIVNEIQNNKLYREFKVNFTEFKEDINQDKEEIKFTDLKFIFEELKILFQKKGYMINWKEFEKNNLGETINTLAMASPFSLAEKQVLLETKNLNLRKTKLEEILNTYAVDDFDNTTIQ
tara:strand:+ start:1421 stop:2068 length:648 start_codon:yes stop_codon:yes gene_type:complete